ncbi:NAD(P)/FAD-dependent oxidoreductase [Pseudoprimorskyibacter insulae]|uniref:Glycine oxidase n=1 Tax=Pseudoprimorskyibacter insulae TaxID=1695997 RepID=A0A2R8AV38_9RHOB|nr:FAD-binding oxidoreductase [Pseudoprimorskyibacter insulae]SPF79903.1 Glycine oxidase [Pseudoprimorskyibacter insulae]
MADVTIRGAGAFGLAIAWACVQRGATVQVVDPYGAGSGSSGGLVGALAPHVPENWNDKKAFQLDSLLMAGAFWSEVEAAGGVTAGYGRLGRIQPLLDDRAVDLAKVRIETAQQFWADHAEWRVVDRADLGDWCPPSPTGQYVFDTLSARMHPRRACAALVAALAAKGVTVVPEAPDSGQVVWAAGWRGLLDLSDALGKPVGNGVKGQAALLRYSVPDAPQLYADSLHIVPHADGTVAIGSTSEREFDAPDSVDAQCDALIEKAVRLMPVLQGAAVLERWAGVRPRAKSRAPMLGAWPDRAGHFIANGGFKIGFGMAPKVALVMADLVLTGQDTIPDDFRVEASL